MMRRLVLPVVITTAWTGMLAGAGVLEVLVHLPARTKIGAQAYLEYMRATLLTRGIVLYPLLGIGGALLAWAAFGIALKCRAPARIKILLGTAAIATLLGMTAARLGAKIVRSLGAPETPRALAQQLDRFATLSTIRVGFVEVTFCCLLCVVALLAGLGRQPGKLVLLMLITTACVAILGGASLPMMIVDRPAWHRIGPVAYTEYARVTDMGPARFIYPPLAWAGAFLATGSWRVARKTPSERGVRVALGVATACAWLVLVMTAGAAPNLLRAGSSPNDPAVLAPLLARFQAWSIPRAIFLVATFWAMLAALACAALRAETTTVGGLEKRRESVLGASG